MTEPHPSAASADPTVDRSLLPASHVGELVRALVRTMRALQMYLPNNPMFERSVQSLQEAFPPIWGVIDELAFEVRETSLVWDGEVVYDHQPRNESFAFWLYKDGMRALSFRRGCEEEEILPFLQTVAQARQLSQDAPDDMLTLLWARDFARIGWRFAEAAGDQMIVEPGASWGAPQPSAGGTPEQVAAAVKQEVAGAPAPEGVVNLEDFEATLYFLDDAEVAELTRQLDEEYARDLRAETTELLFELLETQEDAAAQEEVVGILEGLLPTLLSRAEFRAAAHLLGEVDVVLAGSTVLSDAARGRLQDVAHRLSDPAAIRQLLTVLDEAPVLPEEADLRLVFSKLQPVALQGILAGLPGLTSPRVKTIVGSAAEGLASRHGEALLGILDTLDPASLPGAIQLAGRLTSPAAGEQLRRLVGHASADVRLAAVEALAARGDADALAALEPAIEDMERSVRLAAVAAVARRAYPGARARLEAIVSGQRGAGLERAERRAVFEAYAAVAGPASLELLRTVALPGGLFRKKHSTDDRTCATYALGRLGTAEARTALAALAEDKELPVRHAATAVLRDLRR